MSGRIISRAENWETTYQAFQNINFTAFDYQSIKQSMIDYIKLYFPETFNDFIESSEFVALIELFAYLGELMAYRVDMASHENFLPTAQRKQSILRLAKLISYNVSRNIPARGLVKLTSVSTTEPVFDVTGTNLSGVKIAWNDTSNPAWKEQFFLIMDKVLQQPIGSVLPKDRVQVQDVLFELYNLNNVPLTNGVIPFSVSVSGETYPMEAVPVSLNDNGPYESRPEIGSTMRLLFGNDGLGDGSSGTGFFSFVKQGELKVISNSFDGITPNQTFDIGETNINETDLWVNNVDPDTLQIVTGNEQFIRNNRAGEWVPVDLAHAQNIIYNTNVIRNKYEVETLEGDDVRLIFGDGEFANIPSGLFHAWFRTSANTDLVIPQSAINNISSNLTYVDVSGITRTFTFTFSAVSTIQNAAPSEDIEHVRRMAPAVYYTQDRMVNGRDYNTFMLQDQTILKIRAFNRTFTGESNYTNYVTFNDPSGAYDNVKIFGDDLALYLRDIEIDLPDINPSLSSDVVVRNYVEPLLSNPGLFLNRSINGDGTYAEIRTFSNDEFNEIVSSLDTGIVNNVQYLYFDQTTHVWSSLDVELLDVNGKSLWYIKISKGSDINPWEIRYKSSEIVAESPETKFWFSGEGRVINYDSLNIGNDLIVLLKANLNKNRDGILSNNQNLIVLDHTYVDNDSGPITDIGLPNIHQFSTIYEDLNMDLVPDLPEPSHIPLDDLIDPIITIPAGGSVTLPFPVFSTDISDITGLTLLPLGDTIVSEIHNPTGSDITISLEEYVYFKRPLGGDDYWEIVPTNAETLDKFTNSGDDLDYMRKRGRYPFNFMWMHRNPNHNLIDPASTNIIDMFIITRGYYISMRRWLDGYLNSVPVPPTPQDLLTSYSYLIENKMVSDSIVLHSGKFKILFGQHAAPELQGKFKVIRSPSSLLTDNQIKLQVVAAINSFFDIIDWEFGETFYFSELSAVIHSALPTDIDSVVLVPSFTANFFGDLFQLNAKEDELFISDVTINDIEIISAISRNAIKQCDS